MCASACMNACSTRAHACTRAQGKLPLAIKALAMGIQPHELIINPAKVGQMSGMFDAVVPSGGLDIFGGKSVRSDASFQIHNLPSKATFQSLILVMRSRDPADWTDLRELEKVFWLGCVPQADYNRAVADLIQSASEPIDGLKGDAHLKAHLPNGRLKAYVTIGSKVSWLGNYIRWVRFSDLDRTWWHENVLEGVCPTQVCYVCANLHGRVRLWPSQGRCWVHFPPRAHGACSRVHKGHPTARDAVSSPRLCWCSHC